MSSMLTICPEGVLWKKPNFELYLQVVDGETSENPAVNGKYFSGRGKFYKPWMEIYYYNHVKFRSSKIISLSERGLDEKLFKHLSGILPPGRAHHGGLPKP